MIAIKRGNGNGDFLWTAEDADGEIGNIVVRAGEIPVIVRLEFEQPEIGDGLIKTAAAFFASAGISKLRFTAESEKAGAAALAAGFIQTDGGFELDPAQVKRACGNH